jgi:Metal-dependent amidase/aminoacylase/carboxypeptidase
MTTEDFGYYLKERPGCFYHLGVDSAYPLHNPKFNPKETAIAVGVAMHCMTVEKYLNQK